MPSKNANRKVDTFLQHVSVVVEELGQVEGNLTIVVGQELLNALKAQDDSLNNGPDWIMLSSGVYCWLYGEGWEYDIEASFEDEWVSLGRRGEKPW